MIPARFEYEAGLHRVLTATQQRSLGDAGTNIEELLQ